MENIVLVVGGDMRQLIFAELMSKEYLVYAMGFDKNTNIPSGVIDIKSENELRKHPDIIMLPIVSSVDNEHINMPLSSYLVSIEQILSCAKKSTLVFAGNPCKTLVELCKRKGLRLIDYFNREELTVLNAVPTVFRKTVV